MLLKLHKISSEYKIFIFINNNRVKLPFLDAFILLLCSYFKMVYNGWLTQYIQLKSSVCIGRWNYDYL